MQYNTITKYIDHNISRKLEVFVPVDMCIVLRTHDKRCVVDTEGSYGRYLRNGTYQCTNSTGFREVWGDYSKISHTNTIKTMTHYNLQE